MHAIPRRRRRLRLVLPLVAVLAMPAAAACADAVPLEESASLVRRVLRLADDRMALMPSIAASKWIRHQAITDQARERAVLEAAASQADAVGLAREPVARLFEVQVRRARELQASLHDRWNRDGFNVAAGPPSLADELRPRLDRLTTALVDALYLAAAVLDDAGAVQAAAGEELAAARWTSDARADLLSALVQIRFARPRSLGRARAAGVLRIGTPADYAPFSVAASGRVDGSDIALALRLATALGLQPVFVRTSWSRLLGDLADDRFDIAVGGVSVNDQRRAAAAFSLPIARAGKTAIGRCNDRPRFASMAAIDQRGVRVIENPGGTNEAFARHALHAASLSIHPDNRTAFGELIADRADVMFTDETEVTLAIRRHRELCRLLTEAYETTDKAFLLPRDPAWVAAVDEWLGPELAHGVPAALLEDYTGR